METCKGCKYFFAIPEDADDYEEGKGGCVKQKTDEKGKFWLSKPIFESGPRCEAFSA